MSTTLNSSLHSFAPASSLPFFKGLKVGIAVAEWNPKITNALLEGAVSFLREQGYPECDIKVYHVPGTVELSYAAAQLVHHGTVDAVIVLGCVIRGETSHYDYVCQSVTNGITTLNTTQNIPVIFGVLTVENEQQALDRAGGKLGNKGSECAEVAIKMHSFALNFK